MPANALRHPEIDEEVFPAVSPANNPSPSPSSSDPDRSQQDHPVEWRTVAPYADRFIGAEPDPERAASRRRSRRHRPFVLTGPFLAGTLVFIELMGLIWIYALDLKALRQEDVLKRQIQETSLQIALNQNKLASYKSSPLLSQWASQLGYRPIEANDFDDVTSNAPLPAPPKKDEATP